MITSYSRGQTVVATSNGEAEFYGLSAIASEMMFVLNLLNELGFHFRGRIHADSSSARSIATRKGVGKVKHREIRSLHVQDLVQRMFFVVHKIKS